ncbi:glucocorticoid modulatory element-binding protein 2 [Lampris incognitus]|uniref:glucocorticoid modulatory element-binding protein 2 n=1 Tax=Lampris incognitus TaxID=2546036 RepID=UPI0024B51B0A|nr:glucocorticoid modulatory element-binding protein 2 [Lampris incognitus]
MRSGLIRPALTVAMWSPETAHCAAANPMSDSERASIQPLIKPNGCSRGDPEEVLTFTYCPPSPLPKPQLYLMASADVGMQDVEEVVVVTIPEAVAEEVSSVEVEDKTVLLATELTTTNPEEGVLEVTPIKSDADCSSTDGLSKEEAVIVKLSKEMDADADIFYPITCGDAKATLVWKKFVCPGINIKCVQFNEQLISPKEFVCLAGKSTLKDWKRAIRLKGAMLRKIMDSGELDFYQHGKVCSNTCRSTKIDLVGSKVSVSSQPASELVPAAPASAALNGSPATFLEVTEESTEWVTAIGEDSITFWRGVKEAGLLEEVVEEFQKELQEVLKGLQDRVTEPQLMVKDAALLNNIVHNFGMLDLVKKVLASHKSQMDRYREQYTRSLAALEQQCDEHRRRAKELKSKSQHLNNVLMTLTPVPALPPPKRPRLTRAISGPATISTTPTQITLPLNQLTGLPIGKVLTMAGAPAGASLGGYTLLTSQVGTSELAADPSSLSMLSTAVGVQEGTTGAGTPGTTTFVKVVGPQYQLVTLPAALQGSTQGGGVPFQVSNIGVLNTATVTAGRTQAESQAEAEIDSQIYSQPVNVAPESEEEEVKEKEQPDEEQ